MSTTMKAGVGVGALATFVAAVAAALVVSVAAEAAPTKLVGTVGPSSTISLKTASGRKVASLPRGTYAITVRDRSDEHNFAIRGAGVSKTVTGVDFVGTKTVTVRLGSGRTTFVCTPHADEMRGTFTVR
jgi:hypothetical protein